MSFPEHTPQEDRKLSGGSHNTTKTQPFVFGDKKEIFRAGGFSFLLLKNGEKPLKVVALLYITTSKNKWFYSIQRIKLPCKNVCYFKTANFEIYSRTFCWRISRFMEFIGGRVHSLELTI